MNEINNILFYTSGIVTWAAVCLVLSIVYNLVFDKERTVLLTSLAILLVVGSVHVLKKSELNSILEENTCGKIQVPEKLKCITYQSRQTVYMNTTEKDQPLRLEKFYRENEYQINRQVKFEIKETCSVWAFCKYDYSRMFTEFDGRKDRIEKFLTEELEKQIYFE